MVGKLGAVITKIDGGILLPLQPELLCLEKCCPDLEGKFKILRLWEFSAFDENSETIGRFEPIRQISDFTDSPAGVEKMDAIVHHKSTHRELPPVTMCLSHDELLIKDDTTKTDRGSLYVNFQNHQYLFVTYINIFSLSFMGAW